MLADLPAASQLAGWASWSVRQPAEPKLLVGCFKVYVPGPAGAAAPTPAEGANNENPSLLGLGRKSGTGAQPYVAIPMEIAMESFSSLWSLYALV